MDTVGKSPHKCRKTYISILIDAGVNLRTVQELAGHEKLSTTLDNYVFDRSTDSEQLKVINNALSPKKD